MDLPRRVRRACGVDGSLAGHQPPPACRGGRLSREARLLLPGRTLDPPVPYAAGPANGRREGGRSRRRRARPRGVLCRRSPRPSASPDRKGRPPRRGSAWRPSCSAPQIGLWICRGHHVAGIEEFGLLLLASAGALFIAAVTWLLYLSLEPYVRRHWPQTLISWSRLLARACARPARRARPPVGRAAGVAVGAHRRVLHPAVHARDGASPKARRRRNTCSGAGADPGRLARLPARLDPCAPSFFFLVLFLLRVLLRRSLLAGGRGLRRCSSRRPASSASRHLAVRGADAARRLLDRCRSPSSASAW